jgi:hypothetical protein
MVTRVACRSPHPFGSRSRHRTPAARTDRRVAKEEEHQRQIEIRTVRAAWTSRLRVRRDAVASGSRSGRDHSWSGSPPVNGDGWQPAVTCAKHPAVPPVEIGGTYCSEERGGRPDQGEAVPVTASLWPRRSRRSTRAAVHTPHHARVRDALGLTAITRRPPGGGQLPLAPTASLDSGRYIFRAATQPATTEPLDLTLTTSVAVRFSRARSGTTSCAEPAPRGFCLCARLQIPSARPRAFRPRNPQTPRPFHRGEDHAGHLSSRQERGLIRTRCEGNTTFDDADGSLQALEDDPEVPDRLDVARLGGMTRCPRASSSAS